MRGSESELRDLIEAGKTVQGEPISKLGYFCAPFRPADGPFADRVIKVYRSNASDAQLDRLAEAHGDYVQVLQDCGVALPETEFHFVESRGEKVPVIVQQALPEAGLMRPQMIAASLDEAVPLMEAAGDVIATFWLSVKDHPQRVGFHPSIRNLAVIDGKGVFFDTFPPLIGYSREELGELLITYSGNRAIRMIGPLLRRRVTGIQDEWYSPAETLIGLVGSACRLRPDDAEAFLSWGRDFAGRRMGEYAEESIAGMQAPPQLPGYWTAFRKLLRLQGEPNI
ncbi:hypothetical protein CLV78_104295 [Aliiruegeria haliotis]|uniref:Aminoglycoside phosphotransferase domain-containing protein n=1 Tax=Aliiruegeria haliotis TaxID=1280846 RepID=A0A2T0RRN6_9RHOB|nr:DUF6206 family protein [Aliiruegeria haliotis]PRY23802.1 hypothetical protein CLV78_104295 [Aliiruegeria haliotis]